MSVSSYPYDESTGLTVKSDYMRWKGSKVLNESNFSYNNGTLTITI